MRVAVDFGTSSTCVAIAVPGREPQVVTFDGQPLLPSAVYAGPDGRVFVGPEADRQAAIDPSRYEPHPKRRIDETELLLGASVVMVRDVVRAVLRRAVDEARRVGGGGAVDQLVLTHPADWGGIRTRVLRQAGNGLAGRIVLVPEPVAAAVFHAARFPAEGGRGAALAVLDLGGGTVDVSVVRGGHPAYEVLATRGDHTFGGADVDQLLLDHVGSVVSATDPDGWRTLVEGRELADRRRRRVIHQDVQGAKESLSRHTYTDVPMPPPFPDVHVTRPDLERLITAPVDRAARLTAATIAEAGLDPAGLAGIFLVGGSSRIPLVSRLVHQRCGVVPTTLDQPETVVARGALLAVAPTATQDTPGSGVVLVPRDQQQTRRLAPAHRPVAPPRPSAVLPPPPAPPSSRRTQLLVVGGTAALLAAVASVVVVLLGDNRTEHNPKGSAATTQPSRVIAQYEYQFALPDGWVQTGGEAAKLRTEIKPAEAKTGDDVVFVEEIRLSFDSTQDRARAVDKLRGDFQAAGAAFSGFDAAATFAGRDVIHYRQSLPNKDATVDWYVLFEGRTQVSIGCQSANGGTRADAVATACETIVRTVTITE
ncbi:type VII secretion-associated protein [Actinophytocola algeriensis]|uniref:Type VII secretion-associated protein (TIGR03931 family) n=1 Tax=Actinophytocola algeriensis TaxID=1768010 RepID=A0A7W7VJ64_9PSEU|nr:type VII secretion-associated protein [Actinophytocola algeriensis]MBB4912029.1 type VII secretion-associated protein (TIGR03931 family) [Actinophytocola algeriensis]MBE1477479.1 type VII secretion-associated protein (TIGR03931 family) [Actinophytocola algeriensis]